ncbi:MAG: PaaI family thioesterase [Hyphomicrobiales bacterium]
MPLAYNSDEIIGETGAQKLVGYVLDVGAPDKRARCWLDITESHLNRHKVLHGGITSCLLDSAAGATASLSVDDTGRAPFLSVSLSVNFVAPVKPCRVEAIGQITGGGRNLLFVSSELRDAKGALIATSTGVYKRVPEAQL